MVGFLFNSNCISDGLISAASIMTYFKHKRIVLTAVDGDDKMSVVNNVKRKNLGVANKSE